MGGRDIVVIGASAGGVAALLELVKGLPRDIPAALFLVVHSAPDSPGLLPQLLTRAGRLPASHPIPGEPFERGHIYVAPPDRHMLLSADAIEVTRGPSEHGFRPAIDPLFRSTAEAHGPRVIGVVLSGGLNDGTLGLRAIKRCGGVVIVQDIDEAIIPSMPASAIQNVDVDHVVRMRDLPALLDRLITSSGRQSRPIAGTSNGRSESKRDVHALQHAPPRGELVPFTCPACGGGLWESHDGKVVRFACHVGHGYTAETLMQHQDDGIEEALWTALRALEEKAALRRRMAGQARRGQMAVVAETYEVHARESEEQAERLRAVLTDGDGRAPATESPPDARRAPAARRSGARRRVGKAAKGRSR